MQHPVSQEAALQEEVIWDDSLMELDDYAETQPQRRPDVVHGLGPREDAKPLDIGNSNMRISTDLYRHLSNPDRGNTSARSRQFVHRRRTPVSLYAVSRL